MKKKLLIEMVMTNQCNKRCTYCKLDFKERVISQENIDAFIIFLKENSQRVEYFLVNFFGGEPLLAFEEMKYFLEHTTGLSNIKYSLGTNGLLLDEKKYDFLNKYGVHYYLSMDTETGVNNLKKTFLKSSLENIEINFILNPHTLAASYTLFSQIIDFGFKTINVMPVFSTMKWEKSDLKNLKQFYEFIASFSDTSLKIKKYGYFNGVSADFQYMLDTDGNMYQDLDSLLWIQKQNSDLSLDLRQEIDQKTKIGHIHNLSFNTLIDNYQIKDILSLVHAIPKAQGLAETYAVIERLKTPPVSFLAIPLDGGGYPKGGGEKS